MTDTAYHHKDDVKNFNPKEDPQHKKETITEAPPVPADKNTAIEQMIEDTINILNQGKGKGKI